MKKLFTFGIAAMSLLVAASCGGEQTEQPVDDPSYKVIVKTSDNSDVPQGMTAQWCTNAQCMMPVKVENGEAKIELEDDEYHVHLNKVPKGYAYNPNIYHANKDNKVVEIELYKTNTLTGSGTKADPYTLTTGVSELEFSAATDVRYIKFVPQEAGTYTLKSLVTSVQATNPIDPQLLTTDGKLVAKTDISSTDFNFEYEITVSAEQVNQEYVFAVMTNDIKTMYSSGVMVWTQITKA